jgi:hypothetical protein
MLERDSFAASPLEAGTAENRFWQAGDGLDAETIVAAWLGNRKTRANLLSERARRGGIAIVLGPFQGAEAAVVAVARFSG